MTSTLSALDLHDRYRDLLPEITVSRCPFTDAEITWPLDVVGLDGWFWDYDNPTRRLKDPVAPTWLAMGGAVRLSEPVTRAPFDCMPGPDVPYVVPRILEQPEVRAVLAQVPVGPHTGWTISYFAFRRSHQVPLENLWGTWKYDTYTANGSWRGWADYQQDTADYDFELAPWVESGKLAWIAPGDANATLRHDTAECPYLERPGTHKLQRVHQGEITRY